MKKEWIKIITQIAEMLESNTLRCPNCGEHNIDYIYIGDEKTRIGFLQVWCNNCLKGISISRAVAPEKAKFLSFDVDTRGIIPEYDFIEN